MTCSPPRNTSPHQDSAGTAPSGTPPPAPPTTTDTGSTVPQRVNPTPTAYAHPKIGGPVYLTSPPCIQALSLENKELKRTTGADLSADEDERALEAFLLQLQVMDWLFFCTIVRVNPG